MIDAEYKFGAFVPKVPSLYRNASIETNAVAGDDRCAIGGEWTKLPLLSITEYNDDTSLFEFQLPITQNNNKFLNLSLCGHLLVRSKELEHDGSTQAVRPYTSISHPTTKGSFTLMVKKYRKWGMTEKELKESSKVFLFVNTNHSYKPAGLVSNWIHSLKIGDFCEFKHTKDCLGRISYPFEKKITSITMIAVGAGIAPMLRIIRELLESDTESAKQIKTIRLLYGARTVKDILQKQMLDNWHDKEKQKHSTNDSTTSSSRFRVMYCVGSRWQNVHFGAKNQSEYQAPPLPIDYDSIPDDRKDLGWVTIEKIEKYSASTPDDTGHRIFVCGLPGVYMTLCGRRDDPKLSTDSQLYRLGYRDEQVIKF